tara:strand:- start:595 stop:1842 length:1248 start_codon:yes stop_codon:yes gene_type:complete
MSAYTRKSWMEYIRSRGERLLSTSGDSTWGTSWLEHEEVSRLINHLDPHDLEVGLLARLYHLSRHPTHDFFFDALPQLIRSATHVTSPTREFSRHTGRGKIVWPKTTQARYGGKIDSATFVMHRSETSADVPENRLLKLYLSNVTTAIDHLISRVGSKTLPDRVLQINKIAHRALKEPFMRPIQLEQRASARMRARAFRNRHWGYRALWELESEYEQAIVEGKWTAVMRLLGDGWLGPVGDDDLFELYALVVVLNAIQDDLGFDEDRWFGILRSMHTQVATLSKSDMTIEIYFDRSPVTILGAEVSEYQKIKSMHSGLLSTAPRRPDILIVARGPDGERFLMIEVKETIDDQYMRGSVYKVFGYLYDFRNAWVHHGLVSQQPKALLLFPEPVTQPPVQAMISPSHPHRINHKSRS